MTLERLEELHDATVLKQEENDAFLAAPPPQLRYSNHEADIRGYMLYTKIHHLDAIQGRGEKEMFLDHYLNGGPAPYDYNLPLNMWEDTKD